MGGLATMRAGTGVNVEQASKRAIRKPTLLLIGEGRWRIGKRATRAPICFRRGIDAGTHGRGRRQQHGKPCRRWDKKGTLLNYWNKSPSLLFLTDRNGETDAFPSASANSQAQTPRLVLKTGLNHCTRQLPQSYPGFFLRFSSLSRRRQNRQIE